MSGAPETRAAILEALRSIRPTLGTVADRSAQAVPAPEDEPVDEAGREQFLNAFEALVTEALEDRGTETRELIFETAIPAMVAQGLDAMQLLEGHVAFFLLLSGRLAAAVPAERQAEAEEWLAGFFAGYARELTELALRAEREQP